MMKPAEMLTAAVSGSLLVRIEPTLGFAAGVALVSSGDPSGASPGAASESVPQALACVWRGFEGHTGVTHMAQLAAV